MSLQGVLHVLLVFANVRACVCVLYMCLILWLYLCMADSQPSGFHVVWTHTDIINRGVARLAPPTHLCRVVSDVLTAQDNAPRHGNLHHGANKLVSLCEVRVMVSRHSPSSAPSSLLRVHYLLNSVRCGHAVPGGSLFALLGDCGSSGLIWPGGARLHGDDELWTTQLPQRRLTQHNMPVSRRPRELRN